MIYVYIILVNYPEYLIVGNYYEIKGTYFLSFPNVVIIKRNNVDNY